MSRRTARAVGTGVLLWLALVGCGSSETAHSPTASTSPAPTLLSPGTTARTASTAVAAAPDTTAADQFNADLNQMYDCPASDGAACLRKLARDAAAMDARMADELRAAYRVAAPPQCPQNTPQLVGRLTKDGAAWTRLAEASSPAMDDVSALDDRDRSDPSLEWVAYIQTCAAPA